jgi:hypothetical protein
MAMSVSFHYSARRPTPLAVEEQQAVAKIVAKYSVNGRVKRYAETGEGIPWRPLCPCPPEEFSTADTILEGEAELPIESEEVMALALSHWCNAASALRREIHKALWDVRVDDREIVWDYLQERYDPGK